MENLPITFLGMTVFAPGSLKAPSIPVMYVYKITNKSNERTCSTIQNDVL